MMAVESGLRDYMLRQLGVANVVVKRIAPERIEQGEPTPYITFAQVGQSQAIDDDGVNGPRVHQLQVNCWARTYKDAKLLADAIGRKSADGGVDGFSGRWGEYKIQLCKVEDRDDQFFPAESKEDSGLYLSKLDLLIVY